MGVLKGGHTYREEGHMKTGEGTSLVVQRLRLCTPNMRGPGLISGWGTRSHMPKLKDSLMPQLKSLHAIMKTGDPACRK